MPPWGLKCSFFITGPIEIYKKPKRQYKEKTMQTKISLEQNQTFEVTEVVFYRDNEDEVYEVAAWTTYSHMKLPVALVRGKNGYEASALDADEFYETDAVDVSVELIKVTVDVFLDDDWMSRYIPMAPRLDGYQLVNEYMHEIMTTYMKVAVNS
jgi:hypothetical protein